MLSSTMLFQEAICKEAFEQHDDNLCAPRQIAALLKKDMGWVCGELSVASQELYGTGDWEDRGATPRMVLEFCKKQGYGCVVLHNEEVIETFAGSPTLAFTVHEGHCWFYADAAVRRSLSKRNPNTAQLRKGVKPTQTPAASEWKMFEQEVVPGHYWAKEDDISQVRAWMLQNRINPKAILKDETRIRTLTVHLGRESCHVHSLPETSGDLQKWLAN